MVEKSRHAEIAGAGIAGLTAAAVLAKRGWTVRVHERGSDLREIGAGIFIWENAYKALEEVEAIEELSKTWERVDRHTLRDYKNRVLQSDWLRNSVLYTAKRQDLHRSLANAARAAGAEIVTSSPVAAARPEGILVLDSGEQLQADLVIGADGVHSRVRDSLDLAIAKSNMRDGCGRYLVSRQEGDPVNHTTEVWSGGRRLGIAPVSPDDVYLFLCAPEKDELATHQTPFDPELWTTTYPDFKELIERIPTGNDSRWAPFYEVVCRSWSEGRVAIIGDAAHAMAPNLGQAACVSMANAVALGQALTKYDDVPTALEVWEQAEREMTETTQNFARWYGRMGTQWPRPLEDARSLLVKTVLSRPGFQHKINAAATYYPQLDV